MAYFLILIGIILPRLDSAAPVGISGPAAPPWGADGHRIVCDIAYRNLKPDVRDAVDALLASDPEERFRNFQESCLWADEIRARHEAKYDSFATAHYVNIPRSVDGFDIERDCGHSFCVVEAILEQKAILSDSTRPTSERREALKFLGHFVADLHQPLHAGYGDDRGGNSVRVINGADESSLHSYWDSGFIARMGGDWQGIARDLRHDIRRVDWTMWSDLNPADWATESYSIVEDQVYVFPISPQVEDEYFFRNIQTVEEQLKKGGLRLAMILNEVLANG